MAAERPTIGSLQEFANHPIAPVLHTLSAIRYEDHKDLVDSLPISEVTGIGIGDLPIDPVDVGGQLYKFHVAIIPAGRHVNPHVHYETGLIELEPYDLLRGVTAMHEADVNRGSRKVDQWSTTRYKAGDMIMIRSNRAHSLQDVGDQTSPDYKPVVIAFGCPDSHLKDVLEGGNREMTSSMENGTPDYSLQAA